MPLSCTFNKSSFLIGYSDVYSCYIEGQNFSEIVHNPSALGNHENGASNNEVQSLMFSKCIMPTFLSGISDIFPNLQRLCVRDCGLKKISTENFKGMKYLRVLWLDSNELEEIPGNFFENIESVEDVSFYGNNISKIDPKIFEHFKNLKKIDLRGNANFDEIFDASKNENFSDFLDILFKNRPQNCLNDDIKSFILNNDFKDFILVVNEVEFEVHRFLLEARSSYLGKMIRDNPEIQSLNFDHQISAENFQFVVYFLYEDKMPPEGANMMEIFEAAGVMCLTNLMNYTGLKVMEMSTPEDALEIFILNDKFNVSEELRRLAFSKIKNSLPGIHLCEKLLHDKDKLKKLMTAKRTFDEIIDKDMKKIEELSMEVQKKHYEKSEWIKEILNSQENEM